MLAATTDARGRRFEIVEISEYPTIHVGGETATLSYINFYIANGGVVVPTAGIPEDARVLARLRELFPGREVVGVPARALAWGGGGVHCITQQVPKCSQP